MKQSWLLLAVAVILLTCTCLAGCMTQPAQAEGGLPGITTDISGTWNLVDYIRSRGDGFDRSAPNSVLTIEQEDWLFYGTIDGDAEDSFVSAFCNEEGSVFLFDLSTDESRRLAYGYAEGDNLWISAVGITTGKSGEDPTGTIFADRHHFVRDGGMTKEGDGFTKLGPVYKQVSATQFDAVSIIPLAGDTFSIEGQQDGIIYGTIDQDVDGILTPRKFIAAGAFKGIDSLGHEYDVYLLIDEAREFWILQYQLHDDLISITTVARSEFEVDNFSVISGIREYAGENASLDSPGLPTDPTSLKGTWVNSYIEMINENHVDIQASDTIINISAQHDLMFFGETKEEYWVGDVGGVIFSAHGNSLYMASTTEGNTASLMQGWVDGDTLYLFGTFTDYRGKNAYSAVYERVADPANR